MIFVKWFSGRFVYSDAGEITLGGGAGQPRNIFQVEKFFGFALTRPAATLSRPTGEGDISVNQCGLAVKQSVVGSPAFTQSGPAKARPPNESGAIRS